MQGTNNSGFYFPWESEQPWYGAIQLPSPPPPTPHPLCLCLSSVSDYIRQTDVDDMQIGPILSSVSEFIIGLYQANGRRRH